MNTFTFFSSASLTAASRDFWFAISRCVYYQSPLNIQSLPQNIFESRSYCVYTQYAVCLYAQRRNFSLDIMVAERVNILLFSFSFAILSFSLCGVCMCVRIVRLLLSKQIAQSSNRISMDRNVKQNTTNVSVISSICYCSIDVHNQSNNDNNISVVNIWR